MLMKKRVEIHTDREIRYPSLLSGALESMGFLVEKSPNGKGSPDDAADSLYDLKIEDSQGHLIRGFNLEKWFKSRGSREQEGQK